jgi:hypothetical protein
MRKTIVLVLCMFGVINISACQTVNDSVRGPSQAVGSALAVPQSITQGINSGYTTQTGTPQSNPYGR